MVAQQQSQYRGGYSPRFAQPQRDNGPRPEPKTTGKCPWRIVHSYRIGENFSDITAVCEVPGGVIVRTTSKNARGCSQAMVFVPGASAADFYPTGGAR